MLREMSAKHTEIGQKRRGPKAIRVILAANFELGIRFRIAVDSFFNSDYRNET